LNPNVPLPKQLEKKDIVALGFSDHPCYTKELERIFRYTNTFLHTEPYLDLCDLSSVSRYSNIDMIICSDVLEHTGDPPTITLKRIMSMLRPGGFAIISVPSFTMSTTIEWYPGARSLRIVEISPKRHVVMWENPRNVCYVDINPSFHGGPGDVLEMRLCSHDELQEVGKSAGADVEVVHFNGPAGYEWPICKVDPAIDATIDGRIILLRKRVKITNAESH
jgi:hypothetical protein